MTKNELCQAAIAAMKNAYAPYSHYTVGAALLCDDGTVYTGCNIENAAYGPTVCAERCAIFKAVSEEKRQFEMIAVAGGCDGAVQASYPPCGVCRQVMAEFCRKDFLILTVTGEGTHEEYRLAELLPLAFTPEHIS